MPYLPVRSSSVKQRRVNALSISSIERGFPPSYTTQAILDQTALHKKLDLRSTQS
jgi:hypothetical protein